MASIIQGSQSAVIEMTVKADGKSYKVTHSASDYLLLAETAHLLPGQATLVVSIDGETAEYPFQISSEVHGECIDVAPVQIASTFPAE